MKYLYKENNNIEKTKKVFEKYNELIKKYNNKSKKILLLVPNNSSKLRYSRRLNIEYSEEINIVTYIGFIKKELVKYWPIIVNSCNKLNDRTIGPKFINNSLSDYIISQKVDECRRLYGYFDDIIATNKSIAQSINNNINKASFSLIDFKTIGERIYLSKKNKDNLLRFSYSQMDEIISYYIDILLSNSMLDNSLSIYLYQNYLLNNEGYLNKLKKEVDFFIVESLETCSCAEVDFINAISNLCKDSFIYINSTRDYAAFNNVDVEYIKEKIIDNCIKESNINCTCINGCIENVELIDIYNLSVDISLNQSSQLYSEMVKEVCDKVVELIKSGEYPKDIVIISPINNTILDYQVKNILSENNIKVVNTKKDKKVVDYPYGNALVVASCIFYDLEELIREEEFISFIEIILNVNRIQAFKIYRNKIENIDYKNIKEYIVNKKEQGIRIDEFLIKFYIDKMLNLKYGRDNVNICKQIINESDIFVENIALLGLDKEKSKEQIFIEALKTSINDYYTSVDMAELKDGYNVIITTPYTYISNNINRPIQLWVDIGSNSWNMKIEKELSNVVVLRKTFEEKKIYSDIMEESYKKYYLYNMIYTLLSNCKKVYAFKSEYTVNGYIQESILYSLLLKISDKGGQ